MKKTTKALASAALALTVLGASVLPAAAAQHTVVAGETLQNIAQTYQVTTTSIQAMNSLSTTTTTQQIGTITYGTNFRSAASANSTVLFLIPTNATVTVLEHTNQYWTKVRYVKNGTTYTGYVDAKRVAESTATTTNAQIKTGQSILIPEHYYAKSGETMAQIATKHNYSLTLLLKMNPNFSSTSTLTSGQMVYVPWKVATVKYGVNYRTAPSTTTGQVQFLIPTGATVYVMDQGSTWSYVRYYKDGKAYNGYVTTSYLTVNAGYVKPATSTTKPVWEQKADAIIALGQRYMGTPYEFGAASDQTRTFDCSTFAKFLFNSQGITLPRDSRQQSTVGTTVSRANQRKGDLMFFTIEERQNNTGVERVGHVGIYMGNGKILHTYKVGIGVTISNFSGYWDDMYLFSKRVL